MLSVKQSTMDIYSVFLENDLCSLEAFFEVRYPKTEWVDIRAFKLNEKLYYNKEEDCIEICDIIKDKIQDYIYNYQNKILEETINSIILKTLEEKD